MSIGIRDQEVWDKFAAEMTAAEATSKKTVDSETRTALLQARTQYLTEASPEVRAQFPVLSADLNEENLLDAERVFFENIWLVVLRLLKFPETADFGLRIQAEVLRIVTETTGQAVTTHEQIVAALQQNTDTQFGIELVRWISRQV